MGGWALVPGETPIDRSHLKAKGITTRGELNVHEAENIRKVVVKYLGKRPSRRMVPFDPTWMKRIHKQMFCDVWKWAGRPRRENLNLGIAWHQIDQKLQDLADDLACWERQGVDIHERAALLHHRAVQIHPFPNGNGRWARMLANILLKLNGDSVTEWPEPEMGGDGGVRREYLDALRSADNGDPEPLTALHRRFTPMPHRPVSGRPERP